MLCEGKNAPPPFAPLFFCFSFWGRFFSRLFCLRFFTKKNTKEERALLRLKRTFFGGLHNVFRVLYDSLFFYVFYVCAESSLDDTSIYISDLSKNLLIILSVRHRVPSLASRVFRKKEERRQPQSVSRL